MMWISEQFCGKVFCSVFGNYKCLNLNTFYKILSQILHEILSMFKFIPQRRT